MKIELNGTIVELAETNGTMFVLLIMKNTIRTAF